MTSSYDLSAFMVSISNVVKSCSKMSHETHILKHIESFSRTSASGGVKS